MNELIEYKNTDNIVNDACEIIDSAQKAAYRAVNSTLVIRNWLLGKRICEEELKGEKRAEYGNKLISLLADELTKNTEKVSRRDHCTIVSAFTNHFLEFCRHCLQNSLISSMCRLFNGIPMIQRISNQLINLFYPGHIMKN